MTEQEGSQPERQPASTELANKTVKNAARLAGFIGVPTVVYSAVSTIGVAGTGTAISSLSGAAATSATFAAIGASVGGGMVAGSVVLTGLGIVGGVVAAKSCAKLGGKVLSAVRERTGKANSNSV